MIYHNTFNPPLLTNSQPPTMSNLYLYWEHVSGVFAGLFSYTTTKAMLSVGLLIFSFLFSASKYELLLALFILIIFDTISALYAAYTTGEKIESRKLVRSAFKVTVYGIIISAGHLTDMFIGVENWAVSFEAISGAYAAATEFLSILENFARAGFSTPAVLTNRLKKYLNPGNPGE